MADWVAISSLATAGGTLALAATTYASVRSANRAARTAEVSLLAGLRPLLVQSSRDDPPLRCTPTGSEPGAVTRRLTSSAS